MNDVQSKRIAVIWKKKVLVKKVKMQLEACKWVLLIFSLITYISGFSQEDSLRPIIPGDTLLPGYENSFPVKKNLATVYLFNGTVIKGKMESVYEEVLSYRRKKDLKVVPAPPLKFIAIDSIAVVYFRRNSFFKGMAVGGVVGFVGGYVAGRSFAIANDEGERIWNGIKTGAAIMIPAAILGSLLGPIITRKRFEIWGSRNTLIGVMMKIKLIE
jgi:sRNA-binding regulator protein Hfq